MKNLLVGLQMYNVRDIAEKDFLGTLEKVKALGYDGVEFAGFFGVPAEKVKAKLDQLQLKAVGAHTGIEILNKDIKAVIEYHKIIGAKYIIVPWLNEDQRPGTEKWNKVVQDIIEAGKACRDSGIQLLYHNHDFEFIKLGEKYALDALYDTVDPSLLGAEIDTGWVKYAGVNPVDYVKKYKGRTPIVQLKDFRSNMIGSGIQPYHLGSSAPKEEDVDLSKDFFKFYPLGYGVLECKEIIDAAEYAGAEWIVVEQDISVDRPTIEDARISREYLKSIEL